MANLDASELDLYRHALRSPILDAGCGTGRLLAPLCGEGFDVDGCDASRDMIERCSKRQPDALLWVSALHELAPPRRYASVLCSGVLGLGSTREQDIEALRRLHDALEPSGTLVLVNEEGPFDWRVRDWNEPSPDEILLCSRVDAVNHDDRCVHMTIRAEGRDGRREEHCLSMRVWYRDELVPLLHDIGFATVDVLTGTDPNTFVFIAVRHSDDGSARSLGPIIRKGTHQAASHPTSHKQRHDTRLATNPDRPARRASQSPDANSR